MPSCRGKHGMHVISFNPHNLPSERAGGGTTRDPTTVGQTEAGKLHVVHGYTAGASDEPAAGPVLLTTCTLDPALQVPRRESRCGHFWRLGNDEAARGLTLILGARGAPLRELGG